MEVVPKDEPELDTPPTTIEQVKKTIVFVGSTRPEVANFIKQEINAAISNVEFIVMNGELYDYCLEYSTKRLLKSKDEQVKMEMLNNEQLKGDASRKAIKLYNLAYPLTRRLKREVTKRDLINTGKIQQGELNDLLDFLKLFGYVSVEKSHIRFFITQADHMCFLEENLMLSQQKIMFYQDMRQKYIDTLQKYTDATKEIPAEELAEVYKETV